MEKKLDVQSLVLEITRRCNMRCEHCLRGEAQNLDMQKGIIDKLLEQTESIGNVTFSGGEPTLNISLIRYFFEKARETRTVVSSFYVITNGKENQMELAVTLLKEYPEMEDKEYCGVAISVDDFHDAYTDQSPVRGLAFYQNVKEHASGDESWVIPRGRAQEYGLGRNEMRMAQDFNVDSDSWGVSVEMLYVSADGCIYPDCNLSYEDMRLDYPRIPVENTLEYLAGVADENMATGA